MCIYNSLAAKSIYKRSVANALNMHRLHHRPSAREVNLVDPKPLLSILITHARIHIVVVQHRAQAGVIVHALTSRSVDPVVRLENSSASALGALLARLVDKATSRTGRPADLDLVLLPCCGSACIVAAALSDREEEVVVVAVQGDEGGFLGVLAIGLVRDVDACRTAGDAGGRVVHVHGEQVVPEGPKGHDELGAVPVERAVDGIVALAGAGGYAGRAEIGPRVEVCAGCDADG